MSDETLDQSQYDFEAITIAGTTREIGKGQGYLGLPLRDREFDTEVIQTLINKSQRFLNDNPWPSIAALSGAQTMRTWIIDQLQIGRVMFPRIRDGAVVDSVTGVGTPVMESLWSPKPAAALAIAGGCPIVLRVVGLGHPPVMLRLADIKDIAR